MQCQCVLQQLSFFAMRNLMKRHLCYCNVCLSVRLSVTLNHSCTVLKRLFAMRNLMKRHLCYCNVCLSVRLSVCHTQSLMHCAQAANPIEFIFGTELTLDNSDHVFDGDSEPPPWRWGR